MGSVSRTLHNMKTFLTTSKLLTTISSLPQHQSAPPAAYNAILSGISQELVGLGITHGVCELSTAGKGVIHGKCEIYPLHPNPLFTKRGGSFSLELAELGSVHVTSRKNDLKGYGYLADFVYDGSRSSLANGV